MTGMDFFSVRRGMVLSVAGTIITYELVLVQFNAISSEETSPDPQNITIAELHPCTSYIYGDDQEPKKASF